MRRKQATTKAAGYPAIALVVLLLLMAQWPLLAQPSKPARAPDDAAMHPVPTPLQQPPAAAGAQANCEPATLVARLHQRYMPDVRGCTLDTVEGSFKQADLGPAKAMRQPSNSPSGVVFESDPPADTRLLPNTQATLFVSTGPGPTPPAETGTPPAAAATVGPGPGKQAMTTVPQVRGFAVASAEKAIKGSHLRPVPGGRESSNEPGGSISRTDPPAGTTVPWNALVGYWVSLGQASKHPQHQPSAPPSTQGPRVAEVPSVTGKTPAEAAAILRVAGFTGGEPIPELSLAGTGRISRQDPPGGSRAPQGEMVLLWWPYAWLSMTDLVVIPLLILGSAAGLVFRHVRAKRRLACTRAVMRIRPSLALGGGTRLVGVAPSIGRTLALRTSLQPGEGHFADPMSIERQETQHD